MITHLKALKFLKLSLELSWFKSRLGKEVFKNCSKLEEVKIIGLNELPSNTFVNCESLRKIILGAPLIHIDNDAFVECPSLHLGD